MSASGTCCDRSKGCKSKDEVDMQSTTSLTHKSTTTKTNKYRYLKPQRKHKKKTQTDPCLRCRDERRGNDRSLVRVARAKQSHLRSRQLLCSQSRNRCANHVYHLAMRPHESHARGQGEPPSHIHQPPWTLVAAYSAIMKHARSRHKSFTTAWATNASKHY